MQYRHSLKQYYFWTTAMGSSRPIPSNTSFGMQCLVAGALRWQRLQQIVGNSVITNEPRARTTSIIHATASKPGKACLFQQMHVNKSRPNQVSNIIA